MRIKPLRLGHQRLMRARLHNAALVLHVALDDGLTLGHVGWQIPASDRRCGDQSTAEFSHTDAPVHGSSGVLKSSRLSWPGRGDKARGVRFWCESTRDTKNLCDTVVANFLLRPPNELPRAFHTKARSPFLVTTTFGVDSQTVDQFQRNTGLGQERSSANVCFN